MRKIGAFVGIGGFALVVSISSPAAAFGFHLGPFHFGLPYFGHHHARHHLYMRATPNEARLRNDRSDTERSESGAARSSRGMTSALLYPAIAMPSIIENVFFPAYSSPWPFGYQAIFSSAFAQAPRQDAGLCQAPLDPNAIVARISNEVKPTAEQMQLLQRLGGALGAASGYLAKSCPTEIPPQPVARLQLMESQIEELAMALDIVRPPLQDFQQSLNEDQQSRFAAITPSPAATEQQGPSGNVANGCAGAPNSIDWSISQIDQSVQPTATQRDALADVKQSFAKAAGDLEAHCPAEIPATALSRLDAIQARLDASWRATLSIQVALADFTTKLSDAQKVRLESADFAAR